MITIEMARRLRKRGLRIPVGPGVQYETERLKQLAELYHKMLLLLNRLDAELTEETRDNSHLCAGLAFNELLETERRRDNSHLPPAVG